MSKKRTPMKTPSTKWERIEAWERSVREENKKHKRGVVRFGGKG
jgi:hypothetical protein